MEVKTRETRGKKEEVKEKGRKRRGMRKGKGRRKKGSTKEETKNGRKTGTDSSSLLTVGRCAQLYVGTRS